MMDNLLLGNQCRLTWAEYGAPGGEPVFYFHGMQGSRLEPFPADAIARDMGVRLIAPDRPGYGDSELPEGFRLLDWPDAILQLADKLQLNQFSIISFSSGGKYALACASKLAERIKHISLVSATAPFDTEVMQQHLIAGLKPLYELAAADYPAAIQQAAQFASSPEALLEMMQATLPPCDKAVLSQTSVKEHYLKNISLALHKGSNGIANDLRCAALPWQFDLQDIHLDIDIWHGRDDITFGFPVAEYLADALAHSTTHFLENKGHCFLFEQWSDILERYKR